jgi:hypothetical protein
VSMLSGSIREELMYNELEIKIINNLPPLNVFLRNPHQVLRFCVIHEGNKWFFKWQLTVDRDAFRQEFEFKKVYRMYKSSDQFKPNHTIMLPEYCSPSSPCPILPACPNINEQSPTFHRCLASSKPSL